MERKQIYIKVRNAIHARDGRICQYCGVQNLTFDPSFGRKDAPSAYCIDHVIPVVRGGNNEPYNLVVACYRCNECMKYDRVWVPHNLDAITVGHAEWRARVLALAVDHRPIIANYQDWQGNAWPIKFTPPRLEDFAFIP